MVKIGSGAQRGKKDYLLSRYGSHLVVMNGESSKREVALAQTYFSEQTRRQELQDKMKRIELRNEMKESNRRLNDAAYQAGVRNEMFGAFHNKGYQGLYGGLNLKEIVSHKGLPPKADLLDHIGKTELAANNYRATQADERLRRENVESPHKALSVHFEVGKSVRDNILSMENTPPEDLPPEENIKQTIKKFEREKSELPSIETQPE